MLKDLDRKQRVEVAITIVGILFLVFLIPGTIKGVRDKRAGFARSYSENATAVSALTISKPKVYEVKGDWGRDPFYPGQAFSGSADVSVSSFVLNGIVWDAENPYAIINSEIVKVGDRIGGTASVLAINENSVILEQNNEQHTLNLESF